MWIKGLGIPSVGGSDSLSIEAVSFDSGIDKEPVQGRYKSVFSGEIGYTIIPSACVNFVRTTSTVTCKDVPL